MAKKKKKLKPNELQDFAVRLAKLKVWAGELGLFETMQALEAPLKKCGWEIAAKKQAEMTLRADVEYDPGKPHTYNGFRVRRASDNFVVFWGSGPLIASPNPARDWREVLKFIKKTTHAKFVIGATVQQFVKENRKLQWSDDGKNIIPKARKRK